MELSAVTITRNEKDHIETFIESHSFADEVLVLDSGSSDGTQEIARQMGARVVEQDWLGFARQWNSAFELAKGEWILYGDADHRATARLADEVRKAILTTRYAGFSIPRVNLYRGQPLRFGGWYPDRKVRLFRKGFGRFDESRSVHEQLRLSGQAGRVSAAVIHDTYRDFAEAVRKINLYTSLEAKDHASKSATRLWKEGAGLDLRSRLGFVRSSLPAAPALHFLYRYVMRAGFLDGRRGWEMAVLVAFYEFSVGTKRREQ